MLAALSVPLFDPAAVPSPRPCTLAFAAARRRRQGRPSRKPRHNVRLREAAPWTVASTAAGLHGSGRRRSDDRAPRSWSPQCSLRQANYVHTDASFPVPVPDFSTACGNGNGNANASRPAPAAFLGSAPAELPSSRPLQTNAGARSGGQDRPPPPWAPHAPTPAGRVSTAASTAARSIGAGRSRAVSTPPIKRRDCRALKQCDRA